MHLKEETILTSGNTKETTPLSQLRVDSRGRGSKRGTPWAQHLRRHLLSGLCKGGAAPEREVLP